MPAAEEEMLYCSGCLSFQFGGRGREWVGICGILESKHLILNVDLEVRAGFFVAGFADGGRRFVCLVAPVSRGAGLGAGVYYRVDKWLVLAMMKRRRSRRSRRSQVTPEIESKLYKTIKMTVEKIKLK